MPITEIAKNYGMSAITLNGILKACGVQYKKGDRWVITAKYHDRDYARSVPEIRDIKDGKQIVSNRLKWTESGRRLIHNLLVEKGLVIRQKCLAI
jgi:phage antirepressor YoqD-like protein